MKTMVVLDNLVCNTINYEVIKEVNRIVTDSLNEVSICTMDITNKVIETNTAVVNPNIMGCFNHGVLIASSINRAVDILQCNLNNRKVLYLWNMDWMYDNTADPNAVFYNEDLVVFVRSLDHANVVKDQFNKNTIVCEEFNLEKIWNLLKDTDRRS